MSYIKNITPALISEVIKEAKAIKVCATQDERNRLDVETLDAWEKSLCIYGQMTGSCFSNRAYALLCRCSIKPFAVDIAEQYDNLGVKLSSQKTFVYDGGRHFSAIEFYITLPNADKEQLVDFIKGNTDSILLPFDIE